MSYRNATCMQMTSLFKFFFVYWQDQYKTNLCSMIGAMETIYGHGAETLKQEAKQIARKCRETSTSSLLRYKYSCI